MMLQLAFATVMGASQLMWIYAWKWGLEIRMTKRNGSTLLYFLQFSTILFSEFENNITEKMSV